MPGFSVSVVVVLLLLLRASLVNPMHSVVRGPYTLTALTICSRPVRPKTLVPGQTPNIPPTLKLALIMEDPSSGSNPTEYSPSVSVVAHTFKGVSTGVSSDAPVAYTPLFRKAWKQALSQSISSFNWSSPDLFCDPA
eukprot:CAMPEP_0171322502 /NCGR_PEP_ID=MMETSP0816-20121228/115004_1 /TAXON_ID=420281 /ORGANISM="Proboscia inermis, Strain CCAP1064/1" /LENGTH=136 /DNA_ID=CAMNT_0011821003 /DNA_START=1067 /DNA_END=1477 /DNA_ORIENTATION=+